MGRASKTEKNLHNFNCCHHHGALTDYFPAHLDLLADGAYKCVVRPHVLINLLIGAFGERHSAIKRVTRGRRVVLIRSYYDHLKTHRTSELKLGKDGYILAFSTMFSICSKSSICLWYQTSKFSAVHRLFLSINDTLILFFNVMLLNALVKSILLLWLNTFMFLWTFSNYWEGCFSTGISRRHFLFFVGPLPLIFLATTC